MDDGGLHVDAYSSLTLDESFFSRLGGRRAARRQVATLGGVVGVEGDTRRGQKPFPHPFPARMPIEVARAAVEALTEPGDLVLDPMSGSGVVPRAALDLGRRAKGFDFDPLAVVQGRALTARIDADSFEALAVEVLGHARSALQDRARIGEQWRLLGKEDRAFIDYWFPTEHADELFALSLAIDRFAGQPAWPVLATLFSSLIISRGAGASMAMDLSRSRPHKVAAKVPTSPLAGFAVKAAAFKRYYAVSGCRSAGAIELGDARMLPIADATIDAVVTSPPYLNAIDYFRTSKFSLVFLGSTLGELRERRANAVGTERGAAEGLLPETLDRLVRDKAADPKRRPMLRRYLLDMLAALRESHRVLKPGRQALYVMGPSILSRRDYDAARVLSLLAEEVGFETVATGRRDICESRRSLPPPKRSQRGQSMNKRMTCEFYVALVKPD